jgi:hypothetical protein
MHTMSQCATWIMLPRAQVYATDFWGRYVPAGYGSVLLPTVPGRYVRHVRLFTPVASTLLQSLLGWFSGNTPEVGGLEELGGQALARRAHTHISPPPQFYDSKFVAASEGREVTRVRPTGTVRLTLNVVTRGVAALGYTSGGPIDLADAEVEGELKGGGIGGGDLCGHISAQLHRCPALLLAAVLRRFNWALPAACRDTRAVLAIASWCDPQPLVPSTLAASTQHRPPMVVPPNKP